MVVWVAGVGHDVLGDELGTNNAESEPGRGRGQLRGSLHGMDSESEISTILFRLDVHASGGPVPCEMQHVFVNRPK